MKSPIKVAIIQLSSNDKTEENYEKIKAYLHKSYEKGARFILTPEVSNFMSNDIELRRRVLKIEEKDPILRLAKNFASKNHVWILIGSLAVKFDETINDNYANRSLLIDPKGKVVARYDKIHMFDIKISRKVHFKESRYFVPGEKAILVKTCFAKIGMTICYDLRFPHLFNQLAKAGASLICVPSAFTIPTGRCHWETLLRARALENNVYILAPAQCGQNEPSRNTWGHSLVIDPTGKIISDSGKEPGISIVELTV
tara:strand:- start:123 stop:890 length:768 start_codon:yes stop_codon:yes gene_type:complete